MDEQLLLLLLMVVVVEVRVVLLFQTVLYAENQPPIVSHDRFKLFSAEHAYC